MGYFDTSQFKKLVNIGLIIKFIDGILDILGGLILLTISNLALHNSIKSIFYHELIHDPSDVIANYILNFTQGITPSIQLLSVIYLLSHGIVKIGIVNTVLYRRAWSYILSMSLLFLTIVYELYRLSHINSIILAFLIVVDILIFVYLVKDYKKLKR